MEPFPWLWGAVPVSFPTGCVLSVSIDPVPVCMGLLLTQTLLPWGCASHHPLASKNTL